MAISRIAEPDAFPRSEVQLDEEVRMTVFLRRGDQGDRVMRLQRALNLSQVDGIFGPNTEAAVRHFQNSHDLTQDGIAGPKTLAALGLDPDTLDVVGSAVGADGSRSSGSASTPEVITFTTDETTVPAPVQQRIKQYSDELLAQQLSLLDSLMNAVAQFETTMSFASESEAVANADSIITAAFEKGVDMILSSVPELEEAKELLDAAKTILGATAT